MGARNATCVSVDGRGVLIEGPPGSGKSSLALALIDRGARLVGDDGVMLEAKDGRLIARPHPETHGLFEVRNIGVVPMEVCDSATISLLIRLDPGAPRFIEDAGQVEIEAVRIPVVALWPGSPVLALRAEIALARFGLPG